MPWSTPPHICAVYDVGHQDDVSYLVMQYLEGETLAARLARTRGPLPLPQVLTIGGQLADALEKTHRVGLTHRDLKPANVMMTKSGPRLLDFGLAKISGAAGPISMSGMTRLATQPPVTAAGTILGTAHYMAPEQVEGREADARTDVWALGALLYEMATGRRPFEGIRPPLSSAPSSKMFRRRSPHARRGYLARWITWSNDALRRTPTSAGKAQRMLAPCSAGFRRVEKSSRPACESRGGPGGNTPHGASWRSF